MMNFQQLITMIPVLQQVDYSSISQSIDCPPDSQVLIVVLHGHITISAKGQEPVISTQGFACHSKYGPFFIQVPKTKEAAYAVISYRMLPYPENSNWTLHGPLHTFSEVKIKYMLDELIRITREIHTHWPEEAAAQQFRKRLLLERILFIFIYETNIRQQDKTSAVSIKESLSYINEHYMLNLTLPLLAERAGVSVGHYTVLFKKYVGKTMTSYLRSLRIDKAKECMTYTNTAVKKDRDQLSEGVILLLISSSFRQR